MNPPVTIRTLTDGGQTAVDIASEIAAFVDEAGRTLELAQYDFGLGPETSAIVGAAIRRAHDRGVRIRLVYNVDHRKPIPVPPPPSPDETLIQSLPVEATRIAGVPDLMHHKFVVRDGKTVWTGSTNWTDDSWSREENVIVTIDSEQLAHAYAIGFGQLWDSGNVMESGRVEPRPIDVGKNVVRPWFCPGFGDSLSHRVAKAIGRARRRVR